MEFISFEPKTLTAEVTTNQAVIKSLTALRFNKPRIAESGCKYRKSKTGFYQNKHVHVHMCIDGKQFDLLYVYKNLPSEQNVIQETCKL